MRLYVIGSHTERGRNRLKYSKLISHRIEHFLVGHLQFLASEVFAIEKTRMLSNSYSMLHRRRNGIVHCVGMIIVKTGCDVGRADELEQLVIVTGCVPQI